MNARIPLVAVLTVGGCDIAEPSTPSDARATRDTMADDLADVAEPAHEVTPDDVVVTEREPCGPCDAARVRTCDGGSCGPWGACEIGVCRPAGLLCGLRVDDVLGECQGLDPAVGCPGGYTSVTVAAVGDVLTTCALTEGNCAGATCDPARLPAAAVCGIWHNGTMMGVPCDGATPAEDTCPLGTTWSGRTDYGSRAGFGVGVCVALAGTSPIEGLCGWAHTRSSVSGDGSRWCTEAEFDACPTACDRLGPTDTHSGAEHGWMTCVCP